MFGEHRRYAVYYAPPAGGALAGFGAAWLGWDAATGAEAAGLAIAGLPRPRPELTAAPRRYGFHATLKAPFRLAPDAGADRLLGGLQAVAAAHAPFRFALELSEIGDFLALTPVGDAGRIATIAADCVRRLDVFRAPATPEDLARRNPDRLSAREAAYLADWGYPHVFEQFRFHLTLTGALPPDERKATRAALAPALAPLLAEPAAFEDLALFGEAADGRFRILARHPLGAAAARR